MGQKKGRDGSPAIEDGGEKATTKGCAGIQDGYEKLDAFGMPIFGGGGKGV